MTRSDQRRILVVGAGMVGVNVAFAAANAGHKVTLVDKRERGRVGDRLNLGAIRLCGQEPGSDLDLAVTARRYWDAIAGYVPGIGLTNCGSVALLRDQTDIDAAYRYLAATEDRLSLSMLVGREVASVEPSVARNGHSYSMPTAGIARARTWLEESPAAGSSDAIQLESACR